MADRVMFKSCARSQTHISDSDSTYRIRIRVESPNTLKSSAKSYSMLSSGICPCTACTTSSCTKKSSQHSTPCTVIFAPSLSMIRSFLFSDHQFSPGFLRFLKFYFLSNSSFSRILRFPRSCVLSDFTFSRILLFSLILRSPQAGFPPSAAFRFLPVTSIPPKFPEFPYKSVFDNLHHLKYRNLQ